MRNNNSNDNVTETMQEFYWENCFATELEAILLEAGFSTEAVADVGTSEWGMQDAGRASYDAVALAEEMLATYGQYAVEYA